MLMHDYPSSIAWSRRVEGPHQDDRGAVPMSGLSRNSVVE